MWLQNQSSSKYVGAAAPTAPALTMGLHSYGGPVVLSQPSVDGIHKQKERACIFSSKKSILLIQAEKKQVIAKFKADTALVHFSKAESVLHLLPDMAFFGDFDLFYIFPDY